MTLPRRILAALFLALAGPLPGLRAQARIVDGPSSLVYPDFWHTPLGIHRGTQTLLDLLLGGGVRIDDPAGVACAHMAGLGGDAFRVTVFGVNSGASQIIYNPDMLTLAVYGGPGAGAGDFRDPQGVACLPDGRVCIADAGNNRVAFLRFASGRLRWDHALGGAGQAPGQFLGPRGVALDGQGRLYVADTGNNRVQVFDPAGRFLEAFGDDAGANNALLRPTALAVVDRGQSGVRPAESALFVVDADGTRLQKFSLDGDFLGQAVAADVGRTAVLFDGLAPDYFGNIWVTDRRAGAIHKFDRHLQWLADWGRPGDGDGRLDDPRGIAINRPYGQVFVLERDAAQYLWIGADLIRPRLSHLDALAEGGNARLDYLLSERAWVRAWVEDGSNRRLATLLGRNLQAQGAQTLYWNGALEDGDRVAAGSYTLVLRAEAGYSSASYVQREVRLAFTVPPPAPTPTPTAAPIPPAPSPSPTPFVL